jgi:hypothetical protein
VLIAYHPLLQAPSDRRSAFVCRAHQPDPLRTSLARCG